MYNKMVNSQDKTQENKNNNENENKLKQSAFTSTNLQTSNPFQ